jgi:hypothetical protein
MRSIKRRERATLAYKAAGIEILQLEQVCLHRDRCHDFKNIFAEKFSVNIGDFDLKQSQILKKLIITMVFKRNANFFSEN